MVIDPQVIKAASPWKIDPGLVQAIVNAEGGLDRIVRAVQYSEPTVTTVEAALAITCRSICHRQSDYIKANCGPAFVRYMAGFWAPVGVANDPTHLNENWPGNVIRYWLPGQGTPVDRAKKTT